MKTKDDCIFCKLANGEIPTNKIYEDERFTVIMDANPVSRGHSLIIPKNHYENVFELGDEEVAAVYPLAKRLATGMKEALSADGLNILQNNGAAAGQSVFHFHMHLIPRYEQAENNAGLLEFRSAGISDEEIQEICKKLGAIF